MFREQGGQAGGDERAAARKAHLEQNRSSRLSEDQQGHDPQLAADGRLRGHVAGGEDDAVATPNAAPPPDPARLTATAAAAAPAEMTSQSAMLVNEVWLPAPAPPGGGSKRSDSRSHIG